MCVAVAASYVGMTDVDINEIQLSGTHRTPTVCDLYFVPRCCLAVAPPPANVRASHMH